MNLKERLLILQTKLKVSKDKYNQFGNFKFRNAEDILEALKPFQEDLKVTLTFQDEPVNIGDRFYIKSTVKMEAIDIEEVSITATAYAREQTAPKAKMDESQTTGSSSSYARKYALNALLLLDDSQDSDNPESKIKTKKTDKSSDNKAIVEEVTKELRRVCVNMTNEEKITFMTKHLNVRAFKEIEKKSASELEKSLAFLKSMVITARP